MSTPTIEKLPASPEVRARRRRRRSSRSTARFSRLRTPSRRTLLRLAIKAIAVIILALIFLIIWHTVAFSEESASAGIREGASSGLDPIPKIDEQTISEWLAKPTTDPAAHAHPVAQAPPAAHAPSAAAGGEPGAPLVPTPRVGPTMSAAPSTPHSQEKTLPELSVRELGAITDPDLGWQSSLDLALALELELADMPPATDPRAVRARLYHHLIELSVLVGFTDNPRDNLDALRSYVSQQLGWSAIQRESYPRAMLRPSLVLASRKGSPEGLAILLLVLSDRLNPYLELEPVLAGDLLGLRYRSADHRYTLVPTHLDRLRSDKELCELAFGAGAVPDAAIRALSRREFWGLVIGEVGSSMLEEGDRDRAATWVKRGLGLFAGQARAHLALARIHQEQMDPQSAREEISQALALTPTSSSARLERIKVLEALGDQDAIEEDLRWLSKHTGLAEPRLRLARYYVEKHRLEDARAQLERLAATPGLSATEEQEARRLGAKVEALPWLRALSDPDRSDDLRFEAVDRLREVDLREAEDALVSTMDHANLRLARYAWNTLRRRTSWDLPFDSSTWRAALARRASASPTQP